MFDNYLTKYYYIGIVHCSEFAGGGLGELVIEKVTEY